MGVTRELQVESEAIRDSVLWVCGSLDARMGGPELNASESSSTPQYGIHDLPQPSADLRDSREQHSDEPESAAGERSADVESTGLEEQVQELRGLNIHNENENRPKASFQVISEYENALSPSSARKSSEVLGFKVIKKKGHRLDGPQLENFPNGMLLKNPHST